MEIGAKTENKPVRHRRRWQPAELRYLAEHYGLASDKRLAAQLQRKKSAIIDYASGKRVDSRMDHFYTARALAKLLGVGVSRAVYLWVKRRWLPGRQSAMSQGKNKLWRFSEYGVVKCLKRRPWLVDIHRMDEHYFRSVVIKEWERDPWYTVRQVAVLLGNKCPTTIRRYIDQGRLLAEEKPPAPSMKWIIRLSAIKAFLENDPQPQHRYVSASTARRISGDGARLAMRWLIWCPTCGERVRITAPPGLPWPQVRDRFIAVYVNGRCEHGAECLISLEKGGESDGTACKNSAGANRLLSKRQEGSPCLALPWKSYPAQKTLPLLNLRNGSRRRMGKSRMQMGGELDA